MKFGTRQLAALFTDVQSVYCVVRNVQSTRLNVVFCTSKDGRQLTDRSLRLTAQMSRLYVIN